MTSTNDIRRGFLDYFGGAKHDVVQSAPLVPYNDPTLMFVNAGMVPFKNVFTGLESRETPRAASSQKCVRAGGKHNDLDNVGYTARHHTFFEMLGNFSFGDYFKEQAITHAWTLLTKEWGLDPSRLTTTVYHTDKEAFDLWRKIAGLPEERIIRISTNDNFWSMGDTGPCGPCSEIFYDHGDHIFGGPPGGPDEDGDRFVEIWNLVFMQFERQDDGTDVPLPKPSIDTGMGLERIAAVMQGVPDNYDTDTFKALINASEELTGTKAIGEQKASHRVIADHLRSTSFLLADGVMPSNEGRGYVLRRIMRRAMRHAHILGAKEPLMHRLVGSLAAEMGAAYPELLRAQPLIEATLKQEETQFRRTLDKGIKLLDEATAGMTPGDILAGETAFKLYDTFGFPYDLTEDALRAQGFGVDQASFETAMNNQKAMARAAWKGSGAKASDDVWFDISERAGATEFTGYAASEGEGQVVALVKDGIEVQSAATNDAVTVITNQTPFYGESGGQMGDAGIISSSNMRGEVTDTAKPIGRLHAHQVTIGTGEIKVGDFVTLKIDTERRDSLRANHSATHLLHASLRNRLGEHVTQKGSLVAPDRLRFDFSHNQAVGPQDIALIEADVNAQIRGNQAVTTRLMTPDDAVAAGALALFGEKYGDEVRVLTMGKTDESHYSLELCGGTHVNALGDIALFTIVSEGAVASGIRRIEALTGEAARLWLVGRETQLKNVAAMLKTAPAEVSARIETLISERKRMEKELSEAKNALALSGGSGPKAEAEQIGDVTFMGQVIAGIEPKALRGLADEQIKAIGTGIVAIIAANENSNTVVVAVSPALHGTVTASDLVRAATEAMGAQGGGGRPDMAQGGGPAGAELAQAALDAIKAKIAG
ncbi:alanine--tRNA ligase [Sphingorhabdus sp.]|jgi:alanyl-tRNA synthetase|uniref:alanine--tRNA ligase n=1 Tax=Sphingorhabdus sp. TaxID=1902408 RepID=UPI004048DFF2